MIAASSFPRDGKVFHEISTARAKGTCMGTLRDGLAVRVEETKKLLESLVEAERVGFSDISKAGIPPTPGVYLVSENGVPVYSGKSSNLRRRIKHQLWAGRNHYLASHLMDKFGGGASELQKRLSSNFSFQFLELPSVIEAVWLEHFVIAVLRPRYNGGAEAFGD